MSMSVDDIDRSLTAWKARLQRIDDNLVALETNPSCMLLERAGESGLEGATQARVVPALAAMRELFAQRSLLDDVLDRAAGLRKSLNRVWPGDSLQEIERLLLGPSIALPPVETPIARRGLLDTAETTSIISPDQLLGAMVASFEQARDAVAAVDEAWARLTPEAERAAAEATRLQQVAAGLGQDASAPLGAIRAQLEAVRAQIARDPLGAAGALTNEVAAGLQQLAGQLSGAPDPPASGPLRPRSGPGPPPGPAGPPTNGPAMPTVAARTRSRRRRPTHPARCPSTPAGSRASRNGSRPSTPPWPRADGPPPRIGVTRWLAAAQEVLADEETVERTSSAPLDRRDELLGRLSARRQQARTLLARGRPADPGLEPLAQRADDLLHRTPVPLADAAEAVVAYEARLRSAG